MQELKNSELLQELIEYSKGLGTKINPSFTAERLFVSLIDKIQSNNQEIDSEEFKAVKKLFEEAVVDFSYARDVLMGRINLNSAVTGYDVVYMGLKMQVAIRNCIELKLDSISTYELLKCILDEPSEIIRKALKIDDNFEDVAITADKKTAEVVTEDGIHKSNIADEELLDSFFDGNSEKKSDNIVSQQDDAVNKQGGAVKQEMADLVEEVKNIRTKLKSKVFGQDNAINIFVTGYFRARMLAMTDKTRRRPKATFLFAGPPGVGKTYLAESVADVLNMKEKFKIFDMSEDCD